MSAKFQIAEAAKPSNLVFGRACRRPRLAFHSGGIAVPLCSIQVAPWSSAAR